MPWTELAGWYGAVAILGAYAAHSLGRLDLDRPGHARLYQALNATGALGIVAVSVQHANWQPAVLNGAWTLIALVALLRPKPAGEATAG